MNQREFEQLVLKKSKEICEKFAERKERFLTLSELVEQHNERARSVTRRTAGTFSVSKQALDKLTREYLPTPRQEIPARVTVVPFIYNGVPMYARINEY